MIKTKNNIIWFEPYLTEEYKAQCYNLGRRRQRRLRAAKARKRRQLILIKNITTILMVILLLIGVIYGTYRAGIPAAVQLFRCEDGFTTYICEDGVERICTFYTYTAADGLAYRDYTAVYSDYSFKIVVGSWQP